MKSIFDNAHQNCYSFKYSSVFSKWECFKTIRAIAVLFFIVANFGSECIAQLPFTQPVYNYSKDSAVSFGTTTNYCGFPFELKMNVYKPIGTNQPEKRPLIIFVHGGALVSDANFNEPDMNNMAIEFSKRGYVSASIDYREGLHLKAYATGFPGTINLWNLPGVTVDWDAQARAFAADSAETIRAIYRAQQDVKAAIRYFKLRADIDSVDICEVFLAGHSAGAIAVLQAAFTDQSSEKPILATLQTALPNPNWRNRCELYNPFNPSECIFYQPNGPQGRDNAAYIALNSPGDDYENAAAYLRPDLGPIGGNINPGATDEILGIGAMAGAVSDTNLLVNAVNFPAVFLYHQPADRVVDFNRSRPFSFYNDLLSPGPNNEWPILNGSQIIKNKLAQINYPGRVANYWFDNSLADPLALTSHAILPYISTVADSMAKFFAQILAAPHNCLTVVPLRSLLQGSLFGNSIKLQMEIVESSEQVNKLILQKSSNGRDYFNLTSIVPGRETLFTFIDSVPAPKNFYRMEITTSALKVFSNTVYINYQYNNVKVFPNPVNGRYLQVQINNAGLAGRGSFFIKNMLGEMILVKEMNLSSGLQMQKIDVAALPAGLYLLEWRNNKSEKIMTGSFVKTN